MVYFISGLGADERLFNFLNLSGIEYQFIKWIKPLPNEKIGNYAERLTGQIEQSKEVILVGVSFGGIIAQEIAFKINCKKIILISSVKSEQEYDWRYKLASQFNLVPYVPSNVLKGSASLAANYFFSIKNPKDAAFLAELIEPADPYLIKWSVQQVLNWKSPGSIPNLVHIHGSEDRIFPLNKIKNAIVVPGGGHFMVVDQAQEVSLLLRKEILNASGPAAVQGGQ